MASFLVWDTSGSPTGIQAACVSCCSTSLQAASALPSLHKSGKGNISNTGKALPRGECGVLVDISVSSLEVRRERELQKLPWDRAEIGLGRLPAAAPRQQHLQHLALAVPTPTALSAALSD